MAGNPLGDRLTTIHVSNLHCGSCVLTIQRALASLSPPPLSVEVSVVSQTVTVHHFDALFPDAIHSAIHDAGFDVPELGEPEPSSSKRQVTHVQQCTLCQNVDSTAERADSSALAHSPSVLPDSSFRLTLSVGGMSCASCVNSITRALSEITGVSDVVVSLLESSATALIDQKELSQVVSDCVEDCGFEAHIMSVEPIVTSERPPSDSSRIVSLRVDSVFCKHCPMKVMAALESLGSRLTIITPLTSHTSPIVTVSYSPDPPSFTIQSSNSPPFDVTIHRPPSLEERAKAMHERQQRHLLFRTLFTMVVAIPTFIIGIVFMSLVKEGNPTKDYLMAPMWTGNTSRSSWALFFLSLPVMFYSAGLFHRRSIKEIKALWRKGSKTPILQRFIQFGSMNLLVSTGVTVAFTASVCLLTLSSRQPPQMKGDTTTYFDSVVFLTMFLLAGRYLEGYSKARTSDAITSLAGLRSVEAQLVVAASPHDSFPEKPQNYDPEKAESNTDMDTSLGMRILKTTPDFLEVGDIIRCNTGTTPPRTGPSMLTGESMPVSKVDSDKVYLGSINRGQTVHIKVDTIGGDNMLDNIIKVVREGSTRRAPIERVADVITGYFVPVITLLAILTWLLWLILAYTGVLPSSYLDIDIGGWTVWALEFSIAVFVVACPCGISLAAPSALLVGAGLAAKHGILARGGGEAFQEMERVDVVVFDKTGTLTMGEEPRVSDCEFTPDTCWKREVLLGISAELESVTSHPLAIAIRHYCASNGAIEQSGSSFVETAGLGVEARFEKDTAIIGSQAFMEQHGVAIDESTSRVIQTWKSEAKSVVFLAVSDGPEFGALAAVFAVTDLIRKEAESVVAWFAKQNVSTWMISGDNVTTASAVARMVGIPVSNVIAGVLPHEKGEKIQMLQTGALNRPNSYWQSISRRPKPTRNIVAMVGDGINDAVALTVADIGIAIGSGSDVAISSASFILLSSDLRALIILCDLSRSIMKRVRLNFLWAIMYNVAALPIAAGAVYPAGHVRLDPVWASLAMALSSVSVVCSSLALNLYRAPRLPESKST
ncbi:hypothetical protein B0H17DRAFT_1253904 [Mycena rosella]|uniref:HMA domain-containing protein n=1 Tax=Mycena rosella TaxID=1033263 RepID=A0AAD7GPX2_MYCRO|nr:hypothetical protein B0H17DRAFT_1253904 [Mycena rosella]